MKGGSKGESGKPRSGSIAERVANRIAGAQRLSKRSRSVVADGHGGIDEQEPDQALRFLHRYQELAIARV